MANALSLSGCASSNLVSRIKKMRKTNSTNKNLQALVAELKEKGKSSNLMLRLGSELSRPSRIRREVNLSRIDRYSDEDEILVVPGKILGGGELNHKVTVAALKISGGARKKLEESGSKIISIDDISKQQGKKIRIIG